MSDSELTIAILQDIRDGIRSLDERLTTRIDVTNQRLDGTNQRLETVDARVTLVANAVTDAASQLLLLGRYLRNKTEVEVADLRERVAKLEVKVG